MVKLKAILASLLFLLFIFLSSTSIEPVESRGIHHVKEEKHVQESNGTWKRKLRMNHGSARGPRKHLINPTVDPHPFQVRELDV
ncbi:hypothetical protein LguiA_017712 [Lonicera macranthoides]